MSEIVGGFVFFLGVFFEIAGMSGFALGCWIFSLICAIQAATKILSKILMEIKKQS